MNVLKRNGEVQLFDVQKIQLSMARASDAISQPMNQGDLDYIAKRVMEIAREKGDTVSHQELRQWVSEQLSINGFQAVADAYIQYVR